MNDRKQSLRTIAAREFYQRARWKGSKVGDVYCRIKQYFNDSE